MSAPVILFGYDSSPYAEKVRCLLAAGNVPYEICAQPNILPRPDLEALGITYRRIPVLAIGKDIYCDSSLIIDVIMRELVKPGTLVTSPFDKAFEDWGNVTFRQALHTFPARWTANAAFMKDRSTMFLMSPREDKSSARSSGLASLRARFQQLEDDFLGRSSGPFINGETISLADIHVIWPVRWALLSLGAAKEAGFGREAFPKIWGLLHSLPRYNTPKVSREDMLKTVLGWAGPMAGPLSIVHQDPLPVSAGTLVSIESDDIKPGSHPQLGKLVGSSISEVVIEVGKNGVHAHLPRVGYFVEPVSASNL